MLALKLREENGEARLENLSELQKYIDEMTGFYSADESSEVPGEMILSDRAQLRSLKVQLEGGISRLKKENSPSCKETAAQLSALASRLDVLLRAIHLRLSGSAAEGSARRCELKHSFDALSAPLGAFAGMIWNSPRFYEKRWDNPHMNIRSCANEMRGRIAQTASELSAIAKNEDAYVSALLERYISALSTDGLAEYRERLEMISSALDGGEAPESEHSEPVGSITLKLYGTPSEMKRRLAQLRLMGAEWDELENDMPKEPSEQTEPDFDSFVAVDIETSGSFGAAAGDGRPEITEIGAVKVVNGVITERFSELCNPGRSIAPMVSELTGITDDMVAGKPPVSEVMRRFAEFAGDAVLLGHGFKNSDLPFLRRAAERAGISIGNKYFDTFRCAEKLRARAGFESLKLEGLAASLGVAQAQSHRALSDAETAAGVYFQLKRLASEIGGSARKSSTT